MINRIMLVVLLISQKDYDHSAHKLTYYVVLYRCGCRQGLELDLPAVLKLLIRQWWMGSCSVVELLCKFFIATNSRTFPISKHRRSLPPGRQRRRRCNGL